MLTPKGIRDDFAPDLTSAEKELLLATQVPTQGAALGGTVSSAAWRTKPSWFVIASNDRMIAPDQQRDEAKAMNAKVIKVPTSHVAMLAAPKLVAKVIGDAASGKAAPTPPGGP